jgi:type IV secretion system protein VirB9
MEQINNQINWVSLEVKPDACRAKHFFRFAGVGLLGLLGILGISAYAEQVPMPLSTDHRIQVVAYSPDNVVPIYGTPLTTTQIIFSPEEVVKEVQNGDSAAWVSSINPAEPYMIFLKPTVDQSHSNMTVITNQHMYYFELHAGGTPTYAIRFIYPAPIQTPDEQATSAQQHEQKTEISAFQNPQNFNWDYSFHGDTSIVPLHVFDDGVFTYMQLQPGQGVPAVFVIDNREGKEAVANARVDGRYLVIQKTAPQFTLRLGPQHVASIFNNRRIAELRGS